MANKARTVRRRRKSKGRRRAQRRHSKYCNNSKKFHKALCVLKSMKHSDRCKAIASSNDAFIRQFGTAVRKSRNTKASPQLRKRLRQYRGQLRKLANSKVSIKSKRKILSQKGGLLSAILPPVLSSLIGLK